MATNARKKKKKVFVRASTYARKEEEKAIMIHTIQMPNTAGIWVPTYENVLNKNRQSC